MCAWLACCLASLVLVHPFAAEAALECSRVWCNRARPTHPAGCIAGSALACTCCARGAGNTPAGVRSTLHRIEGAGIACAEDHLTRPRRIRAEASLRAACAFFGRVVSSEEARCTREALHLPSQTVVAACSAWETALLTASSLCGHARPLGTRFALRQPNGRAVVALRACSALVTRCEVGQIANST